jgi:hypothetical protein
MLPVRTCFFNSFSLNTGNSIRSEGAIQLSEVLKSNTSLTDLRLASKSLLLHFVSLNTEDSIGNEGVIKLSEALKSNTSLTKLNLYRNRLTASFHSNAIQKPL